MCASCGCGCKPGKPAKGCDCNCKTCKNARMSVEKSFIVSKAMRNFEAIADAIIVEDDSDHVNKSDFMEYNKARKDMYAGLFTGNKEKMRDGAKRRKAASDRTKAKMKNLVARRTDNDD